MIPTTAFVAGLFIVILALLISEAFTDTIKKHPIESWTTVGVVCVGLVVVALAYIIGISLTEVTPS